MSDVEPEDDLTGNGRCIYCKQRLRSKNRDMHRDCEKEFYNPKPKAKVQVQRPPVSYPPARTCPECKRLDNGLYPALTCRYCGIPTVVAAR